MDFTIDRIKNLIQKTADRLSKRYVPVITGNEQIENLEDRPLAQPAVDVYENDEEVLIRTDVPGGNIDNTKIKWDEYTGLILYIRMDSNNDIQPIYGDYSSADWYRVFNLPNNINGTEARSEISNGVLSIHLPKHSKGAAKSIPVKVVT